MITVGMYYDVLPGKSDEFREKFQSVVRALNGMPGHKVSYLYQRVDDPDSFAILSEWESRDAFLAFIRSEAFKQVTDWGREKILRSIPRHQIYPRAEDLTRPAASS